MHATGGAPFEGIEQRYQLKTMSMYNELKTKDDAWMQSVHERIDRLSVMIDGISDGMVLPQRMSICATRRWRVC